MKLIDRISAEDPEIRKRAHERFLAFLNHVRLDESDPKERVEKLKQMSFGEFMNLLSVANGVLTNRACFRRWSGKAVKSVVSVAYSGMLTIEPPDDAEISFEQFFHEMQEKITAENIDLFAVKLYMAIIFSHMFEDGNGRTARHAYSLLKEGHSASLSSTQKRKWEISQVCNQTSLYAMMMCFRDEGIEVDDIATMQNYLVSNDDHYDAGNMSHLKYLAARRVLGPENVHGDSIELSQFDEQALERYKAEYADLRKRWFWKIQEQIDSSDGFFQYIKDNLDEAILADS